MIFKNYYKTPKNFSNIILNSDGKYLTGLWFEGSKDSSKHILNCEEKVLPIFEKTFKWLDIYFSGKEPEFIPEYKINNLTPFRKEVIDIINEIPYGKVCTYSDISKKIAKSRNLSKMSSQAVRWSGRLESNMYNYSMSQSNRKNGKLNRIWWRHKK